MAEQNDRTIRPIVRNRKALHDYDILQRFEAGIVLTGTEVKSIRAGKVSMGDAYAIFPSKTSDELYLINMHINPYSHGQRENHEPLRKRKLLLHEREIHRIRTQMEEKGLTIVPLELYFSGPYIKLEIGLARGRKHYDKRAAIKEREMKHEARRANNEDR